MISSTLIRFPSCGNVGKLTRIADVVSVPEFASSHPRKNKDAPFLIFGGFADFLVAGSFAQGHGAIIGLANIAPVCLQCFIDANRTRTETLYSACMCQIVPVDPAGQQGLVCASGG